MGMVPTFDLRGGRPRRLNPRGGLRRYAVGMQLEQEVAAAF